MKELKIRLDADAAETLDLWLQSGHTRISRTHLVELLVTAFITNILTTDSTIEAISGGIHNAIKIVAEKTGMPHD